MQRFGDFYQDSEYTAFDPKVRKGGTFSLEMLDVKQDEIETTDPPMTDVTFVTAVKINDAFEIDFGDGWRSCPANDAIVDIHPPNTECHFRLPKLHLRAVSIPEAELTALLDERGLTISSLEACSGQFRTNAMAHHAIQDMWRLAQMNDPSTSLMIDGLMLGMVGHMLTMTGSVAPPMPVAAIGDHRLQRVLDYVEENLSNALNVGDLASVACMSKTQFSRSFRKAMGQTPAQYVLHRRCARADELLRMTRLPITSVAVSCGFRNVTYFWTVYRKIMGRTPATVRE